MRQHMGQFCVGIHRETIAGNQHCLRERPQR